MFYENLLKIRGASYNRVFSRNDCVIQTTRQVCCDLWGDLLEWVRLALSIALKDDLSELKSVTFMLLSMCDSFAIVLKMEAP